MVLLVALAPTQTPTAKRSPPGRAGSRRRSSSSAQIKADLGEYRKGTGASPCPLARGAEPDARQPEAAGRRHRRLRERHVRVLAGPAPRWGPGRVHRRAGVPRAPRVHRRHGRQVRHGAVAGGDRDDREVLITSANFTGRAQHANVELGVLIRDAEFAARVSGQWHTLVARGLFRGHGRDADAAP